MSTDGFLDFGLGFGDDDVGKKAKGFKAKDETTYRATFCWYSVPTVKDGKIVSWNDDAAWNEDGSLSENAQVRFAGCQRIYVKGVGQVLYASPAYSVFKQKPKDCIGTILLLWPTDDEGDLDVSKFKQGKGWSVMYWIHGDGEKYLAIKKINKRSPLKEHDIAISCGKNGAEYQKLTFIAEGENLLQKILASDKPEFKEVARKIRADIKAVAATIHDEMARSLTIDEIREKLGQDTEDAAPTQHASKDVDELLDDVL